MLNSARSQRQSLIEQVSQTPDPDAPDAPAPDSGSAAADTGASSVGAAAGAEDEFLITVDPGVNFEELEKRLSVVEVDKQVRPSRSITMEEMLDEIEHSHAYVVSLPPLIHDLFPFTPLCLRSSPATAAQSRVGLLPPQEHYLYCALCTDSWLAPIAVCLAIVTSPT